MFTVRENTISSEDFFSVYTSVGWEAPPIEQIEAAIANSVCVFGVYADEKLVAVARLIGDMGMSFYIKDFAVLPDFQGKGCGRALMEHIIYYVKSVLPVGWAVSLELISSKGREGFYEKFGFEARPCEWDGAGMFRMVCSEK